MTEADNAVARLQLMLGYSDGAFICMEPPLRVAIEAAIEALARQAEPTAADCTIGSCQRHGKCMYLNHPRCPLARQAERVSDDAPEPERPFVQWDNHVEAPKLDDEMVKRVAQALIVATDAHGVNDCTYIAPEDGGTLAIAALTAAKAQH